MARRSKIQFFGGENKSKFTQVNAQKTTNMDIVRKGRGAKAPIIGVSSPGAIDIGPVGDGNIRTRKMVQSKIRGTLDLYGVFGTKLIAQTKATGNISVGTLNPGSGQVEITRGRNYVVLVDGTYGYTYDGTNFAQISDLDFPPNATHIVYIDGFFIVIDSETDNFYISDVEDPTSWNALDFEAASVAPDAALAIAATESILWIVGEETAQGYYNNGNADFPYTVMLSATQEVGILAPYSISESDDGIFYLATTPEGGRFVWQVQGQSGRKISNEEQENVLDDVLNPASAYAFTYKIGGRSYYVLQLPEGEESPQGTTLVYNITMGEWTSRETYENQPWRAGGHGILDGKNIIGSRNDNKRYRLDSNYYYDGLDPLIRSRTTEIYHVDDMLMDWWEIVIDIESGVGGNPISLVTPEVEAEAPSIPDDLPAVTPACFAGGDFFDDTYWTATNAEWDGAKWVALTDADVILTRITTGPNANWPSPFSAFNMSAGYNSGFATSGEITATISADGGTDNGGSAGHFFGAVFSGAGSDAVCFFPNTGTITDIDSIKFSSTTGEAFWSITCLKLSSR